MTSQEVMASIILGIVANGLSAVMGSIIGRFTAALHKAVISAASSEGGPLHTTLKEAALALSEIATFGDDNLKKFITSPEVNTMLQQVFSSGISQEVSGRYNSHIDSIRRQFLRSMSLRLSKDPKDIESQAFTVFHHLVRCCEAALIERAVKDALLGAHETLAQYRFSILRDGVASIEKRLNYLTGAGLPDLCDVDEFEEKYRGQVSGRHRFISPPHFDRKVKVPMDQLYVNPTLVRVASRHRPEQEMERETALSALYRSVIIGNPGAGKSTFAEKLCHELATRYDDRLLGGRQVTPVLVVLRDYGENKRAHNCSILEYIERVAASDYQTTPSKGVFDYLLRNGRLVIIFDGLDELVDTQDRDRIGKDIESFCNIYPLVPVLVTSRIVGYLEAPLAHDVFDVYVLAPFDAEQVAEYVSKWFRCDDDLVPSEQKRRSDSFLTESESVQDLRSNPLLLALMCNLYWGENYIPRNRPELYKKCSEMLLERWDKRRRIPAPHSFETHLQSTIRFLAHWIYGDPALQQGVTEEILIGKTTEHLVEAYEDGAVAERTARDFVEWCCRGRAWVFADTGLTPQGDRLYQFTHRSFMEYFTAGYLVSTHYTPKDLWDLLSLKIAKKEWDMVAQLAVQMQSSQIPISRDLFLDWMIQAGEENKHNLNVQYNYLHFAARCLEFMFPKPATTRRLVSSCITLCLNAADKVERTRGKRRGKEAVGPAELSNLVGDLLWCRQENRVTVLEQLSDCFRQVVCTSDDRRAVMLLELLFGPYNAIALGERAVSKDVWEFAKWLMNEFFAQNKNSITILAKSDHRACIPLTLEGVVPLESLVNWHGLECVFDEYTPTFAPSALGNSLADHLLSLAFNGDRTHLEALGKLLLVTPPPWVDGPTAPLSARSNVNNESERTKVTNPWSSDAIFGAFCVLGVYVSSDGRFAGTALHSCVPPHLKDLVTLLQVPYFYTEDKPKLANRLIKRLNLQGSHRDFVIAWLRGDFNLVNFPAGKQMLFLI